jgi:carboxymethylenebutenolidase
MRAWGNEVGAEEIWIGRHGGEPRARFFRAGPARRPAILLVADAAGLRPSIFATAKRLVGWGYHVVLPDLYAGLGEPPLNIPEVFAHGPDWQRMNRMRGSLTHARIDLEMIALLDTMREDPAIIGDALACVGLSFGGRFALAAAANPLVPIKLAASIHGGGLAIESSDSPHRRAPAMQGRIYVAAAESDSQMPVEQLNQLDNALSRAGREYEIQTFPGTKHGFGTPESASFDPEATELLWAALKEQLDRVFAVKAAG